MIALHAQPKEAQTHRKLLAYQAFTSIATWVLAFIIPLLILDITNSAFYTSFSYAIAMAPFIVISPLGGIIGDIGSRKKKLINIEMLFIASTFILLIFINVNKLSPAILMGFIFILYFMLASLGAAQHPIFQAAIPSLVKKDNLGKINSSLSSMDRCIFLLGPTAVGAALIFTNKQTIILMATLFSFLSLIVISFVKFPPVQNTKINFKQITASFREALIFLKSHKIMSRIVAFFFLINIGLNLFMSGFVFYLKEGHSFTDEMVGYSFSFIGLGGIIGAYLARYTIRDDFSKEKTIYIVSLCQGIAFCIMYFFLSSVYMTIFLWFVINGLSMITVVNFFTYRQTETPNHLLGRIVGITRSISYMAIPLAAFITGILQQKFQNLDYPVAIAALLLTFTSAACLITMKKRLAVEATLL